MNKTKKIYFLSAIVCIIGCYALNLSYSLFVDTQEKEIVNATVPYLAYNLENNSFTIPANSEEIVKLKIINSGTADLKYGVSVEDALGTIIQLVELDDGDIIGTLSASTTEGETSSKEVWVYVTNPTDADVTLTFNLTGKYSTLNIDEETFKNSSNIDCVNTVKLLKNAILARAKSTEITDETKTVYNDTFNLNSITGMSAETDRMLALAEDDYGTSYVFRGNVVDNYVSFAGFTWRIVRINGDGSIRLVLDGTLDSVSECNDTSICVTTAYGDSEDHSGLGYMTGFSLGMAYDPSLVSDAYVCVLTNGDEKSYDTSITTESACNIAGGEWTSGYDATNQNFHDSRIKTIVDSFYEKYIQTFSDNLSDTLFCADKSLASGAGYGYPLLEYTLYSAANRLGDSYYVSLSTLTPTLECAKGETNTYSRYTAGNAFDSATQTSKGVDINNDLKYPIALLNADELVMAGAYSEVENTTFYLNLSLDYWTMTPAHANGDTGFRLYYYGDIFSQKGSGVSTSIRPVINLNSNSIASGSGTSDNPYIIK